MKILTNPNPILRKKSTPIDSIDDAIQKFSLDLIEKCRESDGLGLAAPQVGKNIRIFVIQKDPDKSEKIKEAIYQVYVNPRITWTSAKKEKNFEGCLSLPGLEGLVERYVKIRVKFQDFDGNKISLKVSGLLARAIQHEYDHLEGILYIDYIKNKRDLKKIKN